jgi:hypothetical protein
VSGAKIMKKRSYFIVLISLALTCGFLTSSIVLAVPPAPSTTNTGGGTYDPAPPGSSTGGGGVCNCTSTNNNGAGDSNESDFFDPSSPEALGGGGGNNPGGNNNPGGDNNPGGVGANPSNPGSSNGGNNSNGGGSFSGNYSYPDQDGDGMRDDIDSCPFLSNIGDKYGGLNGDNGCPVDSDGDNILDQQDQCPWAAAPDTNTGCPSGESSQQKILVAYLPNDGACQIATQSLERVNIRKQPDVQSEISNAMFPQYAYNVHGYRDQDGNRWYLVNEGWVATWVIRSGGNCDELPQLHNGATSDMNPTGAS